ncbi:MAG: hypothetical protein R2864_06715 [Syntrophotaleaceae bacterium]
MTDQLLACSSARRQRLEAAELDLYQLVTRLRDMLQQLPRHIQLLVLAEQGAGRVMADAARLEQVILNLAVNARDAMSAGGRLTIDIASMHLDKERAGRFLDSNP